MTEKVKSGTNVQVKGDNALQLIKTHQTGQALYTPGTQKIGGREYLIVPVVMIREGVHHGSAGALLHLKEELERSVPLWEGKPVTISHPKVNGVFVSANNPQIMAEWAVGEVHEAWMEGDKLRGWVRLDVQRLTALSPGTLEMLKKGEIIEVSVGVFSEEEPTSGEWNGEQYTAINRNYIPDHLALLPGEVGACSVMDGCGVRVNVLNVNEKKGGELDVNLLEMLNNVNKLGFSTSPIVNEVSFSDIMDQLWSTLEGKSNDRERWYLDAVYDDYFIYRKRMITGDGETSEDAGYFKQNYQVGADDKVSFVGDAAAVKKTVSYVTLQEHVMVRKKFHNNQKKEDTNMCEKCKEKAKLLVAHANTHFDEGDLEWLEGMTEDQLDKLIPKVIKTQTKATEPEVTKEQAWQVLGLSQEQYEAGVRVYNEQRQEVVQTILANSEKDTWTKADLDGLKLDVLKKMAKAIAKPKRQEREFANYGGMGVGADLEDDQHEEAPLLMPGVELKSN